MLSQRMLLYLEKSLIEVSISESTSIGQASVFMAQTGNSQNNNCKSWLNRGPDPNLKCKKCSKIGHTIDRCFEIVGCPPGYKKPFNRTFGITFNSNKFVTDTTSASTSTPMSLSNEYMVKLMNLLSDKPSQSAEVYANMVGRIINLNCSFNQNFKIFFNSHSQVNPNQGWIFYSCVNQHMIVSDKELYEIVDVSSLSLKVCNPNGSETKIKKIGNLTNNVTLFDVFVVPGYCVSLLYVNKLANDNKFLLVLMRVNYIFRI